MTPAGAQLARAAFVAAHGREPAGVWSAPGRVNLIGEHTDYNDGLVLPFAIDRRAWVAAGLREDDVVSIRSTQRAADDVVAARVGELRPGTHHRWAGYLEGPIWILREYGHDLRGMDLCLHCSVPDGAGLSSSAAIECASLLAAAGLHDVAVERSELARWAQRAENEYLGVPCGPMDQMAAMLCTAGHVLLVDVGRDEHHHERFDPGEHGLALLVVDTRVRHALADGQYASRRQACEAAADRLGVPSLRHVDPDGLQAAEAAVDARLAPYVRHVVTENRRVEETVAALRVADFATVGGLMDASHRSLAEDFRVSCDELDVAVAELRAAGAVGARMTGGGFGGSAVALVPDGALEQASARIGAAFADRGWMQPGLVIVQPSAGASRDDELR